MEVFREPDAGLSQVLQLIGESEKYLRVNCYLIDDEQVMKAIKESVEKKVNVQVIIDGHPYEGGSHLNLENLRNTGAQVNISPSRFNGNDVFDHAKYMFNEKRYLIGTMNLTQAAFRSNREYFVTGDERRVHKSLMSIFESDWRGERAGEADRKSLIVSPDSENRIVGILAQAKKLQIETEELGDDKEILATLKSKGKKVRIILPSSVSSQDMKNAVDLDRAGVRVKLMDSNKLYMHAKMINTGKFVFIGSQNFSDTSLLKNREVGIIIRKFGLKKLFKNTFNEDWKKSSNLSRVDKKNL